MNSSDRQIDLLIEIAKLLKKFGSSAFEELASSLLSPEGVQALQRVLEQTAAISRMTKVPTVPNARGRHANRGPSEISSDPEKQKLLSLFREQYVNKELLPTLEDVREFIREWKVHDNSLESRQKALRVVLKLLNDLPVDELRSKLGGIGNTIHPRDGLEGWSKIILDRTPKTPRP